MFLCAHETKGYTLEEMDAVFDAGIPAWRTKDTKSKLDQLERDIRHGSISVTTPGSSKQKPNVVETTPIMTRHIEIVIPTHRRFEVDEWV